MKGKWMGGFCVLLLLVLCIAGCGSKTETESEQNLYYLNKEKTKIVAVPYELEETDMEKQIDELLAMIKAPVKSIDYRNPLEDSVQILFWQETLGQLQIYFSSDYSLMDNVTEVLSRAAIVRTMLQVEGIESVAFYVGDAPLMNVNGTAVGLMTADTFIENPGEQINSIQTATLTLYFADETGRGMVKEVQECHYNGNISLEKLVVERMMKGPVATNGISVIPTGTKLVSVSVLDGVCFLNFDQGFLNHNYEIDEGIVMYAIVNSLAELTNVNKVQISVNGDTSINYREKFSLGTIYERNLDYVAPNAEQ